MLLRKAARLPTALPRALRRARTARKHAVFSHGHGQARVAHHQRVEHANAGDASAGNNGDCKPWAETASEQVAAEAQSPVEKLAAESPANAIAGERQNIGDGRENGGRRSWRADNCAADFQPPARRWMRCPSPCNSTWPRALRLRTRSRRRLSSGAWTAPLDCGVQQKAFAKIREQMKTANGESKQHEQAD